MHDQGLGGKNVCKSVPSAPDTCKQLLTALSVKEARERKNVKLVSFDWFEDSLQAHSKKREKPYDIQELTRAKRREKKEKKRIRDLGIDKQLTRHANIVSDAKARYNVYGYSIYFDPTGFMYDITLLCGDALKGRTEKVVLRIYSSDEPPYYYAVFATYFSPDGYEARSVLAPPGSTFEVAFGAFKEQFKVRTKLDWAQRVQAGQPMLLKDGSIDPEAFRYRFPPYGPTGMDLPAGRYYLSTEPDEEAEDVLNQFGNAQALPEQISIKAEKVSGANVNGVNDGQDVFPEHHAAGKKRSAEESGNEEFHTADEGELTSAMHLKMISPLKKKAKKGSEHGRVTQQSQEPVLDPFSGRADVRSDDVIPFGYEPYTNGADQDEDMSPGQLWSPPSEQIDEMWDYRLGSHATGGQMSDDRSGIVTWNWGGRG